MDAAVKHGIQRIVVLGDFGLWWGFDGVKFLDDINALAKVHNRQVFAIPGNHENYEWWESIVNSARASKATSHGWAYARTHVLLSPRVHEFRWGGKQFVVAGGAVSIDKDYRLKYEREKGKQVWSPNEQLTDAEVDITRQYGFKFKTDYLLTHDCSDRTPFHSRLKPDLDSQMHRQKMDQVLRNVQPRFHLHGHMHTKYDWMNLVAVNDGEPLYTQTYGLECNNDFESWGILDLDTDEFTWHSELV